MKVVKVRRRLGALPLGGVWADNLTQGNRFKTLNHPALTRILNSARPFALSKFTQIQNQNPLIPAQKIKIVDMNRFMRPTRHRE